MDYKKAISLLECHLNLHHHCTIDDVEIAESKGWWRFKKPCNASCHHPLHSCIGNEGRIKHTIYFAPNTRNHGRFVSPYEVWNTIKLKSMEKK